jgi:hypothetical protein
MSDGGALATGMLTGIWSATDQATATLAIHDTTGNLLWRYDYTASGTIGTTSAGLTRFLMKNASKKFPFTKP